MSGDRDEADMARTTSGIVSRYRLERRRFAATDRSLYPVARGKLPIAAISADICSIVFRCSMAARRISAKAAGSATVCEFIT
jgi:hypothetical protein